MASVQMERARSEELERKLDTYRESKIVAPRDDLAYQLESSNVTLRTLNLTLSDKLLRFETHYLECLAKGIQKSNMEAE